jgi:hypothetical protein
MRHGALPLVIGIVAALQCTAIAPSPGEGALGPFELRRGAEPQLFKCL